MKKRFLTTIFLGTTFFTLFVAPAVRAQGPSAEDCEYYAELESQLQCGPQKYLARDGLPMCEEFRVLAPLMTAEIQDWFGKVRYCLQAKLQEAGQERNLNCSNLDEIAPETHVECYQETGFCDLSLVSQTELGLVILPKMNSPIWQETAARILGSCAP